VGVHADALLAHPGQQAVVGGEGLDGGVRDRAPRPEQQEAELVDGDGSIIRDVVEDKAGGLLVEAAVLQVEVRPTVAEAG
jgi:hypothetical protein